jgi:hypothetical protein
VWFREVSEKMMIDDPIDNRHQRSDCHCFLSLLGVTDSLATKNSAPGGTTQAHKNRSPKKHSHHKTSSQPTPSTTKTSNTKPRRNKLILAVEILGGVFRWRNKRIVWNLKTEEGILHSGCFSFLFVACSIDFLSD